MFRIAVAIAVLIFSIKAELFSSTAHIKGMLRAEEEIPTILQEYVTIERERLIHLEELTEAYDKRNKDYLTNEMYLNPVDVFVMFKEKIRDWDEIKTVMQNDSGTRFVQTIEEVREDAFWYPTEEEDLAETARSLLRIQDTYEISPEDLVDGKMKHIRSNNTLSAEDIFYVGRYAHRTNDSYHAIQWLELAQTRLETENDANVNRTDLLFLLASALRQQGNPERAIIVEAGICHGNGTVCTHSACEDSVRSDTAPPLTNLPQNDTFAEEKALFEGLCRGTIKMKPSSVADLYCYYKQDRPQLILAPVKAEIAHLDPLIVLFKDVIRDEEITAVKKHTVPDLSRAGAYDAKTKTATTNNRISKNRPVNVSVSEHIERLSKRIDLLTNLATEGEQIVGANYGVGGHFDPHVDFQSEGTPRPDEDIGKGNRIATIIFYLSQPDYGGSTIFTELDLAVKPTKYDAIFWHNLFRNGEEDLWTRHASCPILSGEKWIAIQFIHEIQQGYRRPCGLGKDDEDHFIGDFGHKPSPRYAPNF